jgi:hypothetical protein
MPAHFTHIFAARRVADYLLTGAAEEWPTATAVRGLPYQAAYCGQIMKNWEKYAATGAIGPDLFYFSQDYGGAPLTEFSDSIMLSLAVYFFYNSAKKDNWEPLLKILDKVNSTVGGLVRFVIKLEQVWQGFVKTWESTLGPFLNPASLLDDLTGGVLEEAQVALGELKTGLINFLEQEVLSYADFFMMFDTGVAKGSDEQSLTWGDMVHYRRTSEIAKNLIRQAEAIRDSATGDQADNQQKFEQLLAFALGWLTHVGTDTVGHSFTNTQCGGPYRNHPQRHHLIENHMDAWNYRHGATVPPNPPDPLAANDTYPDLTSSALAFAVSIHGDDPHHDPPGRPDAIPADRDAATAAMRADGELPEWMANAIVKALIRTYSFDADKVDPALTFDQQVADAAARDERAQHDGVQVAKENGDSYFDLAKFRPPTHPLIYGGMEFQNSIRDRNLLVQAILDITGNEPDSPVNELLALIVPDPQDHLDVPHGFPLPWQVQTCYQIMLWYYNQFYTTGVWSLSKPRKPDPVTLPPPQDFVNLLGGPDDSQGPGANDSGEDLCDAIKAAIEWIDRVIDAAVKLVGDLIKMLASPGSYPIRYGLYLVAMAVWDVTVKVHEILAHIGFAVPHGLVKYHDGDELMLPDEIDEPLITIGGGVDDAFRQALADALDPMGNLDQNADVAGDRNVPDPLYPLYLPISYTTAGGAIAPVTVTKPGTGDRWLKGQEFRRPWAYPVQAVYQQPNVRDTYMANFRELLSGQGSEVITKAGPYAAKTTPEVLFRADPGDPQIRGTYEASGSPPETERINLSALPGDGSSGPLGSPVTFSAYLIGTILNDRSYRTQFNLDSDRAYGYLTWDWNRSDVPDLATAATGAEVDHDDLHHLYPLPITPPQSTPPPKAPPKPTKTTWGGPQQPLLMHYIDQHPRQP